MRFAGVLLVMVDVLALAFGVIRFNRERTMMDDGGVHVAAAQGRYPQSRTFGVFVIMGGLVLLVVPRKSYP